MGVHRGVSDRTKCADRSPWYVIPEVQPPDAFLLYMALVSPRLVLNYAKAACTNAIHGLWWRQPNGQSRATAIAFAFLTTLTQLSAELEGRSYGGGVLKLEPSEAARLALPLNSSIKLGDVPARAEDLCRREQHDEATALADAKMLRKLLSANDLDRLRYALVCLRQRRAARATRQNIGRGL